MTNSARNAFTLLELVVVVAVLSILIALLLTGALSQLMHGLIRPLVTLFLGR